MTREEKISQITAVLIELKAQSEKLFSLVQSGYTIDKEAFDSIMETSHNVDWMIDLPGILARVESFESPNPIAISRIVNLCQIETIINLNHLTPEQLEPFWPDTLVPESIATYICLASLDGGEPNEAV